VFTTGLNPRTDREGIVLAQMCQTPECDQDIQRYGIFMQSQTLNVWAGALHCSSSEPCI